MGAISSHLESLVSDYFLHSLIESLQLSQLNKSDGSLINQTNIVLLTYKEVRKEGKER
jgi:hypothetical protein